MNIFFDILELNFCSWYNLSEISAYMNKFKRTRIPKLMYEDSLSGNISILPRLINNKQILELSMKIESYFELDKTQLDLIAKKCA